MDMLYRILIRVWGIVGTMVLGIFINRITPQFQSHIIDQYGSHIFWTFVFLSVATLVFWCNRQKNERQLHFDLCKTTNKLTPLDLGFRVLDKGDIAKPGERPYYSKYISRQFRSYKESDRNKKIPSNDIEVLKKIKEGYNLLLVGQPTEGKTRTAYELLKGLPDFTVVSIRPDRAIPDSDAFSVFEDKSVVIFIDNLSDYVGYSIDLTRLYKDVEKVAKRCVILATCRDGTEYAQVTDSPVGTLQRFYESFTFELSLVPITDQEKKALAEESGLPLASEDIPIFPTPGWIVMREAIKVMENRFRNQLSLVAVDTLYSLKLLVMAGISLTHQKVADTVKDIFHRKAIHLSDELAKLATNAFIKRPSAQDPIQPEPAYLVWIVDYPKEKIINDFDLLVHSLEANRDAKGLNALAITYTERLQDHSKAYTCCQKATKIDEHFSEAWNTLGVVLVGLEQYDDAVDAYQKAIAEDKSYQQAWYNLGNLFAQHYKGKHNEAANAYMQALEIDNNLYHAWVNLGNLLTMSEDTHREGIKAYLRAIEIDKNGYEAWGGLGIAIGKVAQDEEGYEASISAFKNAIRIDENAHEVWNNLSLIYHEMKRYEEASAASRNAQRLDPQNQQYWAVLGVNLSLLGEKEESVQWLCKAWQVRETLLVPIVNEVQLAFNRLGVKPDDCS